MHSTISISILAAAVPALAQGMGGMAMPAGDDAPKGGAGPGGPRGPGGPGGLGSLQDWMPPAGYPPEASSMQSKLYTFFTSLQSQPKFTSVRSVMASAMPASVKQEFATATSPPIVESMAWFSSLPQDVREYVSSMDGALSSIAGPPPGGAPPASATDSGSDAKTTGLGAGAGTVTASGSNASGTKTGKAAGTSTASGSKNGTHTKNAGLVAATPLGGVGGMVVGVMGAVIGAAALL